MLRRFWSHFQRRKLAFGAESAACVLDLTVVVPPQAGDYTRFLRLLLVAPLCHPLAELKKLLSSFKVNFPARPRTVAGPGDAGTMCGTADSLANLGGLVLTLTAVTLEHPEVVGAGELSADMVVGSSEATVYGTPTTPSITSALRDNHRSASSSCD